MAKKKQEAVQTDIQRQTRKDILRARKQDEQLRAIRVGIIIVGVILAIIVFVAIVNEYILTPQRAVASVSAQDITLREWQDRVRFERAQRIITLEDQLQIFNNDVGLLQQYAGQAILELQNTEGLGEAALDRMTQDLIIHQALEQRGIQITDADVDRRISEAFNYYGGESPTPFPTPEATIMPTPSLTPVGANEDGTSAEVVSAADAAPTSAPIPTATPVSEESFQQEFGDMLKQYQDFGVSEDQYRSLVASAIAAERLLEILAEEAELAEQDVHASLYLIEFPSEEEAQGAFDDIETNGFLTVWNTIRSKPVEDTQDQEAATASELLWQTKDSLAGLLDPDVLEAAFSLPVGTPSEIFDTSGSEGGNGRYMIIMVSGRETRPLSDGELRQRKIQLLTEYIDQTTNEVVEFSEFWRSRVPTVPMLDPKFLQQPTPAPQLPDEQGGNSEE